MNHWQYESYKQMDEYNRQRMMAELQAEKLIQEYRVYHPGMFEKTMFRLGSWMIWIGKQLRCRYEGPSTCCSQTASRSPI